MVGWHHSFSGHDFEQTLGDSDGQGILVCCSPWRHKEFDTAEQLNNNPWKNLNKPSGQSNVIWRLWLITYYRQSSSNFALLYFTL